MNREVRILPDPAAIASAAAEEFVRRAAASIRNSGRFTVALSGGSTPKGLYSKLAADYARVLQWDRILFFWSDERHVPPDHPDSNYRMAMESLLSRVPVPAENIHRVAAEDPDAARAAANYEQVLLGVFKATLPRFDLILLGLGPDGHTASLFPRSPALTETQRLVAANWVQKFAAWRITFTAPLLNAAACVMFLTAGAEKAPAAHAVLEGPPDADQFPAQLVQPEGELIWFLDREAAGQLQRHGG